MKTEYIQRKKGKQLVKTTIVLEENLRELIVNSGYRMISKNARDCGLHPQSLHRFVKREHGITLRSAEKLFHHFGVKLKWPKISEKVMTNEKTNVQ